MTSIRLAILLFLAGSAAAGESGPEAVSSRTVDLDKLVEVGRVEAANGFTVSGQPDAAALSVFADSGYAAVIDLRGPDENRGIDEQQVVEKLGMDYVSLPVSSGADLNFENAEALDALLGKYDAPVLVHCGSGNRVGAMLALNAFRKGSSKEEAIEIGRERGLTSLESVVEERIDEAVSEVAD